MSIEDVARLKAVARSGLLDSEREAVFDELTSVAARALNAPFAFMTVVDDTRSFWKSTYGIADGTRQNPVEDSFCQYVIEAGGEDLIVGDATANPTTCNNPSIESMGVRAWAGCAVTLDDQTLGTFCVVDDEVREWTEDDRETLRSLAVAASRELQLRVELADARSTSKAERARTDRVAQVLDTLRSSLMPPSLPSIPGLDLGVWFEAASDGDLLLGDFYDVFPLDGHRWGFVIGDVCGHGPHAARLTSLIRYTLRAAAIQYENPADVLAAVDEAVHADRTHDGRFATAVYLVIDTSERPFRIQLARAGHPYPVLRRNDGNLVERSAATGRPIGVASGIDFSSEQFDLELGDMLLLYTDGVTEARSTEDDSMYGFESLHELIRASEEGSAQGVADGIAKALSAFASTRNDDVALLAIRAN